MRTEPWKGSEVARLRALWRTPIDAKIIAVYFNRSPRALYSLAHRQGIAGKPRARGARNVSGIELLIKSLGLDPEVLKEIAERTVSILRSYEADMTALRAQLARIEQAVSSEPDEDEHSYEGTYDGE